LEIYDDEELEKAFSIIRKKIEKQK
jgi:hypothetical protein